MQENHAVAELLQEIARLLAEQQASEFRVRAYRAAAETISQLPSPIRQILEQEGVEGLIALPTIGKSIANVVENFLRLGRIPLLDRLRGESNAESFFTTLPGVGPELSHRIYEHLHVETLPELYAAAVQGRLEQIPGLGRNRIRAIRENLSQRLGQKAESVSAAYPEPDRSIPVDELLAIDKEYREKAQKGTLTRIAPSKFNPGKVAWMPILHTEREGRHYTALYSNTARAHELNTTKDWVVIYRDDTHSHSRWTVITSQFGRLHGCRIVRGRENECQVYYRDHNAFHEPALSSPPPPELPTKWDEELGRRGIHG
jgi:putative hydrolase